jgi:hypothetical protein
MLENSLEADLHHREAERIEALGLDKGGGDAARRIADRHNNITLALASDDLPTAIDALRREHGARHVDANTRTLDLFEEALRDRIPDLDLKGEHARIAGTLLHDSVLLAKKSGINRLCDAMEKHRTTFLHRPALPR